MSEADKKKEAAQPEVQQAQQDTGMAQVAPMPEPGMKKELTYEDKVIKKIAGIAAAEVPGIWLLSGGLFGSITDKFRSEADKTKGINAVVGEKQVALDLNVVCEYGQNVPHLFDVTIEKVKEALRTITGLELVDVKMHVEDVLGSEEFARLRSAPKTLPEAADPEELQAQRVE